MQGFHRLRRDPRRSPEGAARPAREGGFVLIAAIWLLILAGSITAILMLRSLASARTSADNGEAIAHRLAMESAIETILADRLFNGRRSAWWLTPSAGIVSIDGRDVTLRLTSESGRIDVNAADPALTDGALRGFGVGAQERERIVERLQALRAMKKRINSLAELENLLAGATPRQGLCLLDHFTWISGLAQPRPDQISPLLSRALGAAGAAANGGPAETESGAALRIEAWETAGAPIVAIARVPGLPERPIEASVWAAPAPCGEERR